MYTIFQKLLEENKLRASDVAKATGITSSTFTDWKTGRSVPKQDKLQKIANFFGVSIEYLMTGKEPDPTITVVDDENNVIVLDDETLELIDSLRSKPEMKMLFSVSKNATPEDIIKAVKIIEALRDDSQGR